MVPRPTPLCQHSCIFQHSRLYANASFLVGHTNTLRNQTFNDIVCVRWTRDILDTHRRIDVSLLIAELTSTGFTYHMCIYIIIMVTSDIRHGEHPSNIGEWEWLYNVTILDMQSGCADGATCFFILFFSPRVCNGNKHTHGRTLPPSQPHLNMKKLLTINIQADPHPSFRRTHLPHRSTVRRTSLIRSQNHQITRSPDHRITSDLHIMISFHTAIRTYIRTVRLRS
jgi:hypothetical protein